MKRLLAVMAGLACVCAVSCQRSQKSVEVEVVLAPVTAAESNSFVRAATILGTSDAADVARACLKKKGIRSVIRGDAVYSVAVAPADKAKAIEALQAGSQEYGFPVTFD